jgi:magnesium transporter
MLAIHHAPASPFDPAPQRLAVWYDLMTPSAAEVAEVEQLTGLDLPSFAEMQEIEVSSRLGQQGDALAMTAIVMARAETDHPVAAAVTFIVSPTALVTVRYTDPRPFETFSQRLSKTPTLCAASDIAFVMLMEAIVDRIADVLEATSAQIDAVGRTVFDRADRARDGDRHEEALQRIGRAGTLLSHLSESIVSLGRVVGYFSSVAAPWLHKETKPHLKTIGRDLKSLNDQIGFLSHKTNFLLDATLGLISIEQNTIIKIFTIAAVTFMPPTLVASIYGMNYAHMPELDWTFGYPMAIGLMLLSAALPIAYFRRRGWL